MLIWFAELSSRRSWMAVAGMGGGAVIPAALGYTEIDAWARLTGQRLTPWELTTLTAMDDAWRAAHAGKQGAADKHQGLGDYCRGEKIDQCRAMLGAALETACRTCPN